MVPRPSWREIFSRRSTVMPSWYANSLDVDDRKLWDSVQGEGFYDWYLEHGVIEVESVYARADVRANVERFTQPQLPGLELDRYYGLE
jgi:hypothetical protein